MQSRRDASLANSSSVLWTTSLAGSFSRCVMSTWCRNNAPSAAIHTSCRRFHTSLVMVFCQYPAEQHGEGSIGLCLPLDVLDHEFTVVAEKFLDEAGGEALLCGRGLVERPDGEDEIPGFDWVFADEIVALPEGPEERVVFGRVLRRGLEGDPGPCQLIALVVSHDADL